MIGSKLNAREKLLPTFNVGDLLRVSRNYSPARLLASPDVAAEKIAEVSMNSLLIVVEAHEGWVRVCGDDRVGWLIVSVIERV